MQAVFRHTEMRELRVIVERLPNSDTIESDMSQGGIESAPAAKSPIDKWKGTNPHFIECSCARCNLKFSSKTELNTHLKFDHDYLKTIMNGRLSGFECLECRKVFASRSALKLHLFNESSTFNCPHCEETFKRPHQLTKHLKQKHPGIIHKCGECHRVFKTLSSLIFHSRHHQPPQYPCDRCDRKFYSAANLAGHFKMGHMGLHPQLTKTSENRKLSCPSCGKLFATKINLMSHLRIQHQPAKLKCSICHAEFKSFAVLRRHRAWIHSVSAPKEFECQICSRIFPSQVALSHHHIYHGNRNFSCGICGRQFYAKSHLDKHVESLHSKRWKMPTATSTQQLTYHCSICCRPFGLNYQRLINHLCAHYERTLECAECHQVFNGEKTLAVHFRKHHGSTHDHICDICQKRHPTLSALIAHRRFHGKPQFSCPNCNDKFHLNAHLSQHQLHAHNFRSIPSQTNLDGKDKFLCAVCYKGFHKRSSVLEHLTLHKPPTIPCPKCQSLFRTAAKLRVHMRSYCCVDI